MDILDYILFPFYALLFNFIFSLSRKKMEDPVLKKYHKHGFWIKVFSSLCYSLFVLYNNAGDTIALYYPEGLNVANLILKNPLNIKWLFVAGKDFDTNLLPSNYLAGYFDTDSNFFVIKLVAIFSFFTFQKYLLINLCFSMLSYSGVWRLYMFFYEQYPHMHKKLAIAIIYLPTFVFWSSGILKDPICTGMLGFFTYAFYNVLIKRKSVIKNMLISIASAYIIIIVKPYILFSFLPFYLYYLTFSNIGKIQNNFYKYLVVLMVFVLGIIGVYVVSNKLQDEMGAFAVDEIKSSVKTQQTNFINMGEDAASSFSLGVTFDGSNSSLLKMAPAAVVATLFRPFLWESKKISTLLSSLESLAFMFFTLFVFFKSPLIFFRSLFKDPMILFCIFFSLVFALFVGATTLNFGTLVRYKIPCMPFYLIGLMLIYEKIKAQKLLKPAIRG